MTWWKRVLWRQRREAQLDAELRDHMERQVADYLRAGMHEGDARRTAQLAFGGVEQTKEACRDARGARWVEDTVQDVRYALRQLRRQPAFSVVAVLTLVVGIAANTTIFALVDGVLLKPLPYSDPDRLVHVNLGGYSPPAQFLAFHERTKTLHIGAYRDGQERTLTGPHEPVRLTGAQASAELFGVLGTPPALAQLPRFSARIRQGRPVSPVFSTRRSSIA